MLLGELPLIIEEYSPSGELRRVALTWQVFDTLSAMELYQLAVDLRSLADRIDEDLLRRARGAAAGSPKGLAASAPRR